MKPIISKQQWLSWLSEQKESGLSIAAFCRVNSINADNFYYHHGQLRKKSASDRSTFVRAKLTSASTPIEAQSDITLCVGRSRLHLPRNVSSQWLASLITSLV